MNMMKSTSHSLTPEQRCRALLYLLLCFVSPTFAADPVQKYEGEVAGIFCSACSSHVKAALLAIDGVQSVKITTADKGGLPKLLITSTKPLTREAAIQALGEKAKMYHIQSLKPVTP